MKDSQPYRPHILGMYKYIKANNERFSTTQEEGIRLL